MTSLVRSQLLSELADIAFRPSSPEKGEWFNPRSPLNSRVLPGEDKTTIEVEVPGVNPEEVKVRVEGRSLSVDTPRGSVYYTIGQRIDAENAEAELKNGLLTISIPKRDARVVHVKVVSD
jgi:HSP20 family molecular chaperone IbpA